MKKNRPSQELEMGGFADHLLNDLTNSSVCSIDVQEKQRRII